MGQKSLTLYKEKTERCEASGGTDDIGNDGGNMFNWKSMLSVIASVPPKQLQKLDSAVHTTGGGGDAEMLSWDSFCGYMDVKKLLKKLLGLSSHRIEVEGVMKSGDKFDADKNEMNNSSVPEGSSILPVQSSSNEVVVCDVNGPSTILQKQSLSLLQTMQMASNKVKGIVLYGPSGCGKSFLAKVIAAEVSRLSYISVFYNVSTN